MKPDTSTRLTLAGLCILVILMGFAAWKLWQLSDGVTIKFATLDKGIQTIIELQETRAVTLQQTVNNQAGEPVTVTTTREEGETEGDFFDRHTSMVDYVKAH